MKILTLIAAVCLGVQTIPNLELVKQWESFKLKYGKQYSSATEENFRMKIFADNLNMIETHNEKYDLGLVSYNLAMNKLGDLLLHEITNIYKKSNKSTPLQPRDKGVTFIEPENVRIPDSIDWRKKGAVTPVKDQKGCLSFWAFSTTGSLEGQHFLKTKKLVSLSEQNLIDCTSDYGNSGCIGGNMVNSFQYIIDNHGIDTEESYPYTASQDDCRFNPKTVGATAKGYVEITSGSEKELQVAVANIGPVSVGIDGTHRSFWFYHGGVYDEPKCTPIYLTYTLLVVGYGTTKDGKDYWIAKNSMGVKWGEKGYIRMSRNKNNQCNIASLASYPLM